MSPEPEVWWRDANRASASPSWGSAYGATAAIEAERGSRFAAYVELLHLRPIVVVVVASAAFAVLAAGALPSLTRIVPFLTAMLLTQFAISLHNDYCDRELDARAKPWRALPRGLVAPRLVLGVSVGLVCAGLASASLLGPSVAALVAACTAAGFAYNAWLKRTVWVWIAFWIALPTLVVAAFAAFGQITGALLLAYPIGAPLALSIYLADTLDDVESDTREGIRGLAQVLGPSLSRWACWSGIAAATVLALVLRPAADAPLWPYGLPIAFLGFAVLADRWDAPRGHWSAIVTSAIALAAVWLIDLARATA